MYHKRGCADLATFLSAGKGGRQPRAIVQAFLIDTAGDPPAVREVCPRRSARFRANGLKDLLLPTCASPLIR